VAFGAVTETTDIMRRTVRFAWTTWEFLLFSLGLCVLTAEYFPHDGESELPILVCSAVAGSNLLIAVIARAIEPGASIAAQSQSDWPAPLRGGSDSLVAGSNVRSREGQFQISDFGRGPKPARAEGRPLQRLGRNADSSYVGMTDINLGRIEGQ